MASVSQKVGDNYKTNVADVDPNKISRPDPYRGMYPGMSAQDPTSQYWLNFAQQKAAEMAASGKDPYQSDEYQDAIRRVQQGQIRNMIIDPLGQAGRVQRELYANPNVRSQERRADSLISDAAHKNQVAMDRAHDMRRFANNAFQGQYRDIGELMQYGKAGADQAMAGAQDLDAYGRQQSQMLGQQAAGLNQFGQQAGAQAYGNAQQLAAYAPQALQPGIEQYYAMSQGGGPSYVREAAKAQAQQAQGNIAKQAMMNARGAISPAAQRMALMQAGDVHSNMAQQVAAARAQERMQAMDRFMQARGQQFGMMDRGLGALMDAGKFGLEGRQAGFDATKGAATFGVDSRGKSLGHQRDATSLGIDARRNALEQRKAALGLQSDAKKAAGNLASTAAQGRTDLAKAGIDRAAGTRKTIGETFDASMNATEKAQVGAKEHGIKAGW